MNIKNDQLVIDIIIVNFYMRICRFPRQTYIIIITNFIKLNLQKKKKKKNS